MRPTPTRLLLTFAATLALAGCGGPDAVRADPPPAVRAAPVTVPPVKVGIALGGGAV